MARVCRAVPCCLRDGRSICYRVRDRRDKAYVLLSRRYVCDGGDDVTAWSDATISWVDRKTCGDHVFAKRSDAPLVAILSDNIHTHAFSVLVCCFTVGFGRPVAVLIGNLFDFDKLFGCWLAFHVDAFPLANCMACLALSARTYLTVSGPLPRFQTAQMSSGLPRPKCLPQ